MDAPREYKCHHARGIMSVSFRVTGLILGIGKGRRASVWPRWNKACRHRVGIWNSGIGCARCECIAACPSCGWWTWAHPGNACMSICHCHFQSENLTEMREIAIAHNLSIYGVLHTKFWRRTRDLGSSLGARGSIEQVVRGMNMISLLVYYSYLFFK